LGSGYKPEPAKMKIFGHWRFGISDLFGICDLEFLSFEKPFHQGEEQDECRPNHSTDNEVV
jgi:hypothetical protein